METFTHQCIKCKVDYTDNEPDAYYCESCLESKNAITREIDKKVGSTVGQKPSGDYQLYAELSKKSGTPFVNAKQLGL